MTAAEWIKLRLPNGASFTKNGVTQTIDEAVTASLDDHSSVTAEAQKRRALADLLEVILSDTEADNVQEGDYASGKSATTLLARIKALREEADAIIEDGTPLSGSGITLVDANFDRLIADENSRCQ